MSQVPPTSLASSDNSNAPAVTTWNNPSYDNVYTHQFAGQPLPHLQNWLSSEYTSNVPFFPTPQFPTVQQHPSIAPIIPAPLQVEKFESSDGDENDENEPPRKSPKLSVDNKYLDLDANLQPNYSTFPSPVLPSSFTHSTPKMSGVYPGIYTLFPAIHELF
jgi:hypothetical protein